MRTAERKGRRLRRPLDLLWFALASCLSGAVAAQPANLSLGEQVAWSTRDDVVRVTTFRRNGDILETGFGFIFGLRGEDLFIATADHVLRGEHPVGDVAPRAEVTFLSDRDHPRPGAVLSVRLPADKGDLGILQVRRPEGMSLAWPRSVRSAELSPGTRAWRIGKQREWLPPTNPGQFAGRLDGTFLGFDGMDAPPGSSGGPVVTENGLAGMISRDGGQAGLSSQVLPIETIRAMTQGWHLPWDILPEIGTEPGPAPRDVDSVTGWVTQDSGTRSYLNGVFFQDARRGWIVGARGTILHTTDGGAHWHMVPSGLASDLEAIVFVGPKDGVAVGDGGVVLRTEDGGASWAAVGSGTHETLMSVSFVDGRNGWAAGNHGTVLKTQDGGLSWKTLSVRSSNGLWGVAFADKQRGWAVGEYGSIYATVDGGDHWTRRTSGTSELLCSVYFLDALHGWTSGDKGALASTADGGITWQLRESMAQRHILFGITFVNRSVGWAVGQFSTIVSTGDGGVNWDPRDSGTSYELKAVFFVDGGHGWAVGADGAILASDTGK